MRGQCLKCALIEKQQTSAFRSIQSDRKSLQAPYAIDAGLQQKELGLCRIYRTLRVTPAMESGLTDHVWELAELLA